MRPNTVNNKIHQRWLVAAKDIFANNHMSVYALIVLSAASIAPNLKFFESLDYKKVAARHLFTFLRRLINPTHFPAPLKTNSCRMFVDFLKFLKSREKDLSELFPALCGKGSNEEMAHEGFYGILHEVFASIKIFVGARTSRDIGRPLKPTEQIRLDEFLDSVFARAVRRDQRGGVKITDAGEFLQHEQMWPSIFQEFEPFFQSLELPGILHSAAVPEEEAVNFLWQMQGVIVSSDDGNRVQSPPCKKQKKSISVMLPTAAAARSSASPPPSPVGADHASAEQNGLAAEIDSALKDLHANMRMFHQRMIAMEVGSNSAALLNAAMYAHLQAISFYNQAVLEGIPPF